MLSNIHRAVDGTLSHKLGQGQLCLQAASQGNGFHQLNLERTSVADVGQTINIVCIGKDGVVTGARHVTVGRICPQR